MSDESRAPDQARCKLEAIKRMVVALECDYDRMNELSDREGDEDDPLGEDEVQELVELREAAGGCSDFDAAQQVIHEDPLSVQVRSDWHDPGARGESMEYRILLCWGGPSCQIVGDLGRFNEPESARIQYQDWFTPWTDFPLEGWEEAIVLKYVRQFWFGE